MAISQKKLIQFLRGTVSTKSDAIVALKGVKFASGQEFDGTIVVARYTDNSVLKSIFGLYAGSDGNNPSVTIFDNLDDIVTAAGLTEEGVYSANTAATYISGASSLADADTKLDTAVKNLADKVTSASTLLGLSSPKETLAVSATTTGTTADVNHDKVTIKQSTGNTYENGDTIADNDLYAADAIIEDSFDTVTTVGNLLKGSHVSGGTTVIELLKQILIAIIDVVAVKPTLSLSISPNTTPQEVGSVVTVTATTTYTDGYFTGATSDYVTKQAANCAEGNITYKSPVTSVTTASTSYTFDAYTLVDGANTWKASASYGASTTVPVKNNKTASSVSIAAGTATATDKTIYAYYKWYVGNTTAASIDDIVLTGTGANVSDVISGWESASTVTMRDTWSSNGKSIFVLVKGTLTSFKDSLSGEQLIPNFVKGSKTIAIGGTSTASYTAYLWTITNGAIIASKELKMTK